MQTTRVVTFFLSLALIVSAMSATPLKFFVGVNVDHPIHVIPDGATLWAVLRHNESYVLKRRQIQVESYQYLAPHISDEPLTKRKLRGPGADRAVIHFAGTLSLKEGPITFNEAKHRLVHYSFNKQLRPPTPYKFELAGRIYKIIAEVTQQHRLKSMRILLKSDDASQVLWSHDGVSDPTALVDWVGDLDRDGTPDLLITTGYHYSANTKRLYFSSSAQNSQFVREVGQLDIAYD
ncbi:MAG: hypothetical protein ACE5H0_12860 [Bacteroidota bacterium]